MSELGTLGKWLESSNRQTSAGQDISPGLCCFSLASQLETATGVSDTKTVLYYVRSSDATCDCSKGVDVLALLVGSNGKLALGFGM